MPKLKYYQLYYLNNLERERAKRRAYGYAHKEEASKRSKKHYYKNGGKEQKAKKYAKNAKYYIKKNYQDKLKRLEKLAGSIRPKKCQIKSCKSKIKICFDHDHKTGKFRGWICDRCNRTLGTAIDSSKILRDLALYLDEFNEKINS